MTDAETKPRSGGGWTDEEILAVWEKGRVDPGYDPSAYRRDSRGSLIEFARYGETVDKGRGWEVDHIKPVNAGGTHDLSNLQPLQWQNNRAKGDKWPESKNENLEPMNNWL